MNRTILPIVAIVGDIDLAKKLSERFANERKYFAIMEEPWLSRIDADNEVVKRNNLLAFTKHNYLILAGCKENTYKLLTEKFPERYRAKVIVINNYSDLEKVPSDVRNYFNKTNPRNPYISYSEVERLSDSAKIGVIENINSIGETIAENFCLANGYNILKIKGTSKELQNECEDLLRAWNCASDSLVRTEARERLFNILRERVGALETKQLYRVVFFTRGIPYGILPFQSPVAHLFLDRDLGLQILRGYRKVLEKNRGVSVALLCDPGEIPDSEISDMKGMLSSKGVELIELYKDKATTYNFMHLIERYPFDIAIISSHAGEVEGRQITEKFIDAKDNEYEIVYDLYACFAPVPGEDNVIVQELTVLISVDGIPWNDKKQLKANGATTNFSLKEFMECRENEDKRTVIRTQDCKGVKFSNALKLYELSWLPAIHVVGEQRYPIIFNNACSSWIEMSGRFIFAEASVYIGTTKDINTTLAKDCASRIFQLGLKRNSFLYACYQAQREYVAQLGYSPYLYWGSPDVSIKPSCKDNKLIRNMRVLRTLEGLRIKEESLSDNNMKKKIRETMNCISKFG